MARILGALVAGLLPATLAPALPAYAGQSEPVLPPTGGDFQLGGVRDVPDRVDVVVRDRRADPPADTYHVCYVNGFQTQQWDGTVVGYDVALAPHGTRRRRRS